MSTEHHWRIANSLGCWLINERHCPLMLFERNPWGKIKGQCSYRPDLIGVRLPEKKVIEIEIKTAFQDFINNPQKKEMVRRQDPDCGSVPSFFYFAFPDWLIKEVIRHKKALGDAGILIIDSTSGDHYRYPIHIAREAPENTKAKPLTSDQLRRCYKHQAACISSLLAAAAGFEYEKYPRKFTSIPWL